MCRLKLSCYLTVLNNLPLGLWTCPGTRHSLKSVELPLMSEDLFRIAEEAKQEVSQEPTHCKFKKSWNVDQICLEGEHFHLRLTTYIEVGKPVGTRSRLKTLTPLLDESHILRVGGRIGKATVPYDVTHPIIIPQDHQLSRLIIMDCHKKLKHEAQNTFAMN